MILLLFLILISFVDPQCVTMDPFPPNKDFGDFEPISGYYESDPEPIPPSYDARKSYPACRYLYDLIARGSCACGECGVQSMVAMKAIMNCTKNNFTVESGTLSAYFALACAKFEEPNACAGGIKQMGIARGSQSALVTGSNTIGKKMGCLSYKFPLCKPPLFEADCPNKDDLKGRFLIGAVNCTQPEFKSCDVGGGDFILKQSKQRLQPMIVITPDKIKRAIMEFGGVIAGYYVNDSFIAWKSDKVFTEVEKGFEGKMNHYVTVFGWGEVVQDGEVIPFWWIKNTWGIGWGDKGLAKIKQGINGLGSEITQGEAFHPECQDLLFDTLREEIYIDEQLKSCYSLGGGRKCGPECEPFSYTIRDIDFACFEYNSMEDLFFRKGRSPRRDVGGYIGVVRKTKILKTCISI